MAPMEQADRGLGPKPPVVIANPTHDHSFVGLAERLVANGVGSPEALQAELRKTHPRAVVRERQISAEPVRIWYAYRDGHWVDSRDDQAL
jgi:hypothetical protein